MRTLVGPLLFTLLTSLAGLAAAEPVDGTSPPPDPSQVERPRGTMVWVDPIQDVAQDARAGVISNVLFINRCPGGCQITPGTNDARANTSTIVGNAPRTVSEFNSSDDIFNQVVQCVKDVYAPYDVEVTTTDPGSSVLHHEAILAGWPEEIGMDSSVGGVAPGACAAINNVISFSFANSTADRLTGTALVDEMCWTVAQESAHSFGLPNHSMNCLDPMTYISGCGRKYFKNEPSACGGLNAQGQFVEQQCVCGVSRPNSHQVLTATFGPTPGTPPGPTVDLFYPAADAQVSDGFTLGFSAVDPRSIDHADIYVNGTKYATTAGLTGGSTNYSVTMPALPNGYLDIEVRVYNDIDVVATDTVTVLKGSPCSGNDQCFANQSCGNGRCSYPPADGMLGDSCAFNEACLSGICGLSGDSGMCTQSCTFGVEGSCPGDFECIQDGVCWITEEEGGCCTVAGGQERGDNLPLVALSLFGGALLVLRGRGRRRARA